MSTRSELEDKTFEELSDMASEQEVKGRSSMNKAELLEALSEAAASPTVKRPRREKPKATSSKEDEYKELLESAAAELNRRSYNGHYPGCPGSRDPDKACACRAGANEALRQRILDALN